MDFKPHCENRALRMEAPGPPNEVLAVSPAPSLLFSPKVPGASKLLHFEKVSSSSSPPGFAQAPCLAWMPVLLSADFSYNCEHLSEVFPGFLICTTCGLQVLLFSTDPARCGHLMGTRCEPSRTCSTCMAIIL